MTVHKAKGREFDAVAVIEAHDGAFPHFTVARITDPIVKAARVAESRRVFYVASTRAKRMLMFVSDTRLRAGRYLNTPSPFLGEMGLEANDDDDDQPF
jgi:DNA helicase-2/ATP-dependent DNA helicase PcrA